MREAFLCAQIFTGSEYLQQHTQIHMQELRCPMCRCEWGAFTWRVPPKRNAKAQLQNTGIHMGSKCQSCGTEPILGSRYQCGTCWKLDLCRYSAVVACSLLHTHALSCTHMLAPWCTMRSTESAKNKNSDQSVPPSRARAAVHASNGALIPSTIF